MSAKTDWLQTRYLAIAICDAGKLPGSVLTRYDLLGTHVHGRLQHAYQYQLLINARMPSGSSTLPPIRLASTDLRIELGYQPCRSSFQSLVIAEYCVPLLGVVASKRSGLSHSDSERGCHNQALSAEAHYQPAVFQSVVQTFIVCKISRLTRVTRAAALTTDQ